MIGRKRSEERDIYCLRLFLTTQGRTNTDLKKKGKGNKIVWCINQRQSGAKKSGIGQTGDRRPKGQINEHLLVVATYAQTYTNDT